MKRTIEHQAQPKMRRATDPPQGGQKELSAGGIPMRTVNYGLVLLALAVALFLMFATWRAIEGYIDMQNSVNQYISWQQNAADMQSGSDYLTEQARGFVTTGDPDYIQNYFYEVTVNKRRDKALATLESQLADTESYRFLELSMEESEALMERERYAMRLGAEANGLDLSALPSAVQQVQLSAADAALPPGEKGRLAVQMLYDETYQAGKDAIHQNFSQCFEELNQEREQQQSSTFSRLLTLMKSQEALIALLMAVVLVIVLFTSLLIIRPIRNSLEPIRAQKPLPLEGSAEFRFLAKTYNTMFEEHRQSKEKLAYDATHDALTGLFNRSAYETLFKDLDESDIALMLVDVDKFKTINDTYGHQTGDKVLTKVASTLTASFRSDDYVCRIGGDEFAVIMTNVSSDLQELVRKKVKSANDRLLHPMDGVPPVSLSVGVAFGDRKNSTGNIFKDADAALYEVKRNGRNGCAFYE